MCCQLFCLWTDFNFDHRFLEGMTGIWFWRLWVRSRDQCDYVTRATHGPIIAHAKNSFEFSNHRGILGCIFWGKEGA